MIITNKKDSYFLGNVECIASHIQPLSPPILTYF